MSGLYSRCLLGSGIAFHESQFINASVYFLIKFEFQEQARRPRRAAAMEASEVWINEIIDGSVGLRSDLWPCPPPLWGRWTPPNLLSPRRRKRRRFLRIRTLALQTLVICLSWLTLGHAMQPPEYARAGYPASPQQEVTLAHLEALVDYFLRAGTQSLDSLGRSFGN